MPQEMLDAFQPLRYVGTHRRPLLLEALGLLLKHRQPHGDVEPVEQMFA